MLKNSDEKQAMEAAPTHQEQAEKHQVEAQEELNQLALSKWQGFHWTFFIDVQGLILCLLRFEKAYQQKHYDTAIVELNCASALLKASGAAMQLAGSFKSAQYQQAVRPSMMPPNMSIDDFSGLLSWDHARLIELWRKLSPIFGELPKELAQDHKAFVDAFVEMISAHRAVCKKFVGGDSSIRSNDPAINVLESILSNRLSMIDPNNSAQCPFSGDKGNDS